MSFQQSIDKLNCIASIPLTGDINACSFNCFNTLAIGTSDKTVSVWIHTEEGYKEASYSPILKHEYSIVSVAFTKDGLILASSSADGITYLFNSLTGRLVNSLVQSIGGGVRQSAIALTQRLLGSVTDEGYIFLWNLDTYQNQRFWLGHEALATTCLAFSPDTFLLATGDSHGTFKLWFVGNAISAIHTIDALLGHVQKDAHDGDIHSIAFSPNSYTDVLTGDYQMCSGGYDEVIQKWHIGVSYIEDHNERKPCIKVKSIGIFRGHASSVTCVRYSCDGKYIGSTSLDCTVRIWECDSTSCVQVIKKHAHSTFCCAFSSGFAFFATGSNDKFVNIWKLTNAEVPVVTVESSLYEEEEEEIDETQFSVLKTLDFDCHINSLDFNTSNELVIGCSDKSVRIFYQDGMDFKPATGIAEDCHMYPVVKVEFSKCGNYLVTGSLDGKVIVWNYKTRTMVQEPFDVSLQGSRVVRICPVTNRLALGANDGKVYLQNFQSPKMFTFQGHVESVNCAAFTPDGEYLATGCSAGDLKFWKTNPSCSNALKVLRSVHDMWITTCDFSKYCSKIEAKKGCLFGSFSRREYLLATGGQDSLVKVFKVRPRSEADFEVKEIFCIKGHGGTVVEVRFSNKSTNVLASAGSDRTVRIWNMQTGQCLNTISVHKNQVTCVAFSTDCSLLASGSLDSTVVITKLPTLIRHQSRSETNVRPILRGRPDDPVDLDGLHIDEKSISLYDLIAAFKSNSGDIPEHMICPITQDIFVEPVICEDGFTYESDAIQSWMTNGRNTSPMTNVPLMSTIISPNYLLKQEIKEFLLLHYKK